jgi:uncharacterized membrane protein
MVEMRSQTQFEVRNKKPEAENEKQSSMKLTFEFVRTLLRFLLQTIFALLTSLIETLGTLPFIAYAAYLSTFRFHGFLWSK